MVSIVPAGTLAYGMQLPVQSQSRIYTEAWEGAAGTDELVAVAQAADRSGFLYVAVCDHVAIPREMAGAMSTVWYDTVATLGYLAACTRQVRLLTHVYVLAYRHPLITAKAIATLDALSGGRALLGVGAGHVAGEFAALGLDFHRRGALLDEALPVVAAALTEEFGTGDVGQRPRPVQQPRPPIWVGGSSPAAIRRAAEVGDGWLPQGNPRAQMPELVAALRAARVRDDPIDVGAITEWIYVGMPSFETRQPLVSGSAEQVADSLREYASMGVTNLQVRFPSRSAAELVEQVERFGREVGPLLRAT